MRVAIICIGNEWQADDGFGVAVLRYLEERYAFGPEVSLLDRAVMGYGIVPDLLACDAAVVVDALDGTGAPPGTLFSFDPEDMACAPRMGSLHEVRFADVLASARFMGVACAGYCLGVQVERVGGMGLEQGLSNAVAQAVPLCARSVARVVERRFGCAVRGLSRMMPVRCCLTLVPMCASRLRRVGWRQPRRCSPPCLSRCPTMRPMRWSSASCARRHPAKTARLLGRIWVGSRHETGKASIGVLCCG